ncbi:MAG TPA: AI-2E family transporter, partial [Candidatus Binatia bacterium]|nr:AI-2E family transporter [Candidatus Binatia bacterium]
MTERGAAGIGPRERRWLLAFLVLGSAYFAVLLIQILLSFFGGFSQILLIVFLAWLLAFVMSPVVRFFERQHMPRGAAVGVAYLFALVGLGFVLFTTGAAITQQLAQATDDFPATATRIEATLAGYQSTLGLDRLQIDLVELFHSAQEEVGNLAGAIF